ncbi:uncharacterized protein LOC143232226 isoform X2 [Tachypleus tridentatus]
MMNKCIIVAVLLFSFVIIVAQETEEYEELSEALCMRRELIRFNFIMSKRIIVALLLATIFVSITAQEPDEGANEEENAEKGRCLGPGQNASRSIIDIMFGLYVTDHFMRNVYRTLAVKSHYWLNRYNPMSVELGNTDFWTKDF